MPTKALNQAVKRNAGRFPPDFMFQLDAAEKAEVVTNCDHLHKLKFSKALPFAFTEYGAVALANVLASAQAVETRRMRRSDDCSQSTRPSRTPRPTAVRTVLTTTRPKVSTGACAGRLREFI